MILAEGAESGRLLNLEPSTAAVRKTVDLSPGFLSKVVDAGGLPVGKGVALVPVSYGGMGPGGLQIPGLKPNVGAGLVAQVKF